ncbi:Orn/DAP/Arg decarboxylase 2 domain protein, partial [mine drainage metagenome]
RDMAGPYSPDSIRSKSTRSMRWSPRLSRAPGAESGSRPAASRNSSWRSPWHRRVAPSSRMATRIGPTSGSRSLPASSGCASFSCWRNPPNSISCWKRPKGSTVSRILGCACAWPPLPRASGRTPVAPNPSSGSRSRNSWRRSPGWRSQAGSGISNCFISIWAHRSPISGISRAPSRRRDASGRSCGAAGSRSKRSMVGGGLAIDYEGTRSRSACSMNYSMEQYAEVIVRTFQEASEAAGCVAPDLMSESGRALCAHHAVLVTDVIE